MSRFRKKGPKGHAPTAKRATKRTATPEMERLQRLLAEGSASNGRVRKRLIWLASQRGIPIASLPPINTCKVAMFCKKHDVDIEWAISGSLTALQAMLRKQPQPPIAAG